MFYIYFYINFNYKIFVNVEWIKLHSRIFYTVCAMHNIILNVKTHYMWLKCWIKICDELHKKKLYSVAEDKYLHNYWGKWLNYVIKGIDHNIKHIKLSIKIKKIQKTFKKKYRKYKENWKLYLREVFPYQHNRIKQFSVWVVVNILKG